MQDGADFLCPHPPFDDPPPEDLRAVARGRGRVPPAGVVLFEQGDAPLDHLCVIRKGAVRILHDGRVLDELQPGELIGQAAMLAGPPARFGGVATVDPSCYRISDAAHRPVADIGDRPRRTVSHRRRALTRHSSLRCGTASPGSGGPGVPARRLSDRYRRRPRVEVSGLEISR